jgi:hypothetical protein
MIKLTQHTIRKNLLQIYASNGSSEINDDIILSYFFPSNIKESADPLQLKLLLVQDPLYIRLKDQIQKFKQELEHKVLLHGHTERAEVVCVLRDVVLIQAITIKIGTGDKMIYEQQMELLRDLIREIFTNKWSSAILGHFEFVYPFLKDWYSFFLSYTNKQSHLINSQYSEIFVDGTPLGCNRVARFIAHTLFNSENMFDGFIDEREIDYGNDLKDKIDSALVKSLTFVQLVSRQCFSLSGKNWVHYEYKLHKEFFEKVFAPKYPEYAQVFRENMFFIIAGPNLGALRPTILPSDYHEWYATIDAGRYMQIPVASNMNDFSENIHVLGEAILRAKHRLIENVPV